MITGFFRSSRSQSVSPPIFLVMFLFHMLFFSWYICIMSTLPRFLFYCMDSHLLFFSLPRLSCSVSYHRKTVVQNVYKDIKIYIFLCPPSTPDCRFCFALLLSFKRTGERDWTVPLSLPSLIHLNLKLSAIFHPVSAAFFCTSLHRRPDQSPPV